MGRLARGEAQEELLQIGGRLQPLDAHNTRRTEAYRDALGRIVIRGSHAPAGEVAARLLLADIGDTGDGGKDRGDCSRGFGAGTDPEQPTPGRRTAPVI